MITFRLVPASVPAALLATAGLLSAGQPAVAADQDPDLAGYGRSAARIIARGLDDPRGLAFGPRGELYIAEAGRHTAGASGAITVAEFGHQWRVVSQLPSTAAVHGDSTAGPSDVAVGADGDIVHVAGTHLYRGRAVLAGAGTLTAVLITHRGHLVVDSTGNALLRITPRGRVQTVATFPAGTTNDPGPSVESRPSSVAVGPDGAYYVGEQTGFPSPSGAARVWRIRPGEAPEVYATGFTRIADLAWSADGRLYVLESTGLVRVTAGRTREPVFTEGLTAPAGLALRGRAAYISDRGDGMVLRVPL